MRGRRARAALLLWLALASCTAEPPPEKRDDSDLERQHELRREAEQKLASALVSLDSARARVSVLEAQASGAPAVAPDTDTKWDSSVKLVGPDHYRVVLPPMTDLAAGARFVTRDDRVKIHAVRRGSFFRALGLQSGDAVTAVDGVPMTRALAIELAGRRWAAPRTISIDVERAKTARRITVDIVDSL